MVYVNRIECKFCGEKIENMGGHRVVCRGNQIDEKCPFCHNSFENLNEHINVCEKNRYK